MNQEQIQIARSTLFRMRDRMEYLYELVEDPAKAVSDAGTISIVQAYASVISATTELERYEADCAAGRLPIVD